MGLLDDLQVEVRTIRVAELDQNAELKAQEEFYNVHLRPAMLRAYDYFSEIVESLNVIASDIKVSYPLNPLLIDRIEARLSMGKYFFSRYYRNWSMPYMRKLVMAIHAKSMILCAS